MLMQRLAEHNEQLPFAVEQLVPAATTAGHQGIEHQAEHPESPDLHGHHRLPAGRTQARSGRPFGRTSGTDGHRVIVRTARAIPAAHEPGLALPLPGHVRRTTAGRRSR